MPKILIYISDAELNAMCRAAGQAELKAPDRIKLATQRIESFINQHVAVPAAVVVPDPPPKPKPTMKRSYSKRRAGKGAK